VSEEMLAGAALFFAEDLDGVEGIRASMWAVWRSWNSHQDLILGMLDARGTDPAVREMWNAWIQRFVVTLGDAVAHKRTSGAAAPGPDPHDLMVVLLAAIERTFERMSRTGTDPDQAGDLVETLVCVWSLAIYGTYRRPGDLESIDVIG